MSYDPTYISAYFDSFAEQEWARLEESPRGRVSAHLHRLYLERHVASGELVLDVGAGPGRFTIELAGLGARVVVGDISPVQLELNRRYVAEAGFESSVVDRHLLDIVDMSRFADGTFDRVVAYGGALSYVFERADVALDELRRVLRPGGTLLLSAMSLVGSTRFFLPGIVSLGDQIGFDLIDGVRTSGDVDQQIAPTGHRCHMFRWSELRALVEDRGFEIVEASSSNCLSLGDATAVERFASDPDLWKRFLKWEEEFCREPGAIDDGTHIIVVARRSEG